MKIFLDDLRDPPNDSWTVARNVQQFKKLYHDRTEPVDEISLDHDLGDWNQMIGGDGHDTLVFLEEQFELNDVKHPPHIHIHTSNPSAAKKMRQAVFRIKQRCGERARDKA